MSSKFLLLAAVAAVALAAAPALAQHAGHDHGSMHPAATSSDAVAEGTVQNGVRVVELTVTGNGFEPSKVKVRKGEKVRLVVTRKTQRTCATEIVIRDAGINTPLPLDKAVAVEFTPTKTGELRYTCGMGMIGGTLFVL
jgi:plastocyanin domain-containing protein